MFPNKKQWKDWSLPSKLTAIGTYTGIISLLISIVFFLAQYKLIEPETTRRTAKNTRVAHATGKSGNWGRYEVCVTIPNGAIIDKESVESKVISGVEEGRWGGWEGDFRYIEPNQVCRIFAHQIHDQDRILEISVAYETKDD